MNDVVRVAKRIPRSESEGPGARYVLWVQGCTIRCEGCCNPEMFTERGGEPIAVADLISEIEASRPIEGITILGGEPFEQAAPLVALTRRVRAMDLGVMVFTGYERETIEQRGDPDQLALISQTDLLVDGPFVASKPGSRWRWLGSQNQRMFFLTGRYAQDDPRFVADNTIDIRIVDGRVEISGWAPLAMQLGVERLRRRR